MELKKLTISESNSLFDAYLNNFNKVKDFYPHNFESGWDAVIQKRKNEKFERNKIVEILNRQNKAWGAPQPVFENISELNSDNCFMAITGQQAGIFSGPLYTIYKILTTIKLSEWLGSKYSDSHFIPCFWMEVDDHDFQEINHIQFFNKNNELHRLEISEEPNDSLKPIYTRQITSDIANWKQIIKDEFHKTEFLDDILEKFFKCYSAKEFYPNAFAKLITEVFGKYGLVVLNPADPKLKKIGQPFFEKALEANDQIHEVFEERNQLLIKSEFPVQIQLQPNQTLLFYTDNEGNRVRIDSTQNGDFLLKYNDHNEPLAKSKLAEIIKDTPEQISPNVALRPLIQDYIFPTVGYIAGPAEVTYFAQISAIYNHFEQTMPVIYPRHRITIIENKIQRILDKLEIDISELFKHKSDFLEFHIQQKQSKTTFNEIESIQNEINQKVDQLEKIISEIDPTLINTIQKTGQKINSNIEQVIHKLTNAIEQKEAVEINQVKRTLLHLFPENNFQERVINIIYLLIKYGPDFIHNLYEKLPVDSKEHYILNL